MAVLAIDQGTTGTTVLVIDEDGRVLSRAYREIPQHFPNPGWVEHDAEEIWEGVAQSVEAAVSGTPATIDAVGITNQRETTVIWDATTGKPIHNAIVWQCRRTADHCRELCRQHGELIRQRTGLPVDPYFSGTKIRWLLDNVDIPSGADLRFGTVDSWLVWKLTGGSVHATDVTNASRTLLLDIALREWSPELCGILGVPMGILPEIRPSVAGYGKVTAIPCLAGVPITGVAGDQQAALFGQCCFDSGQMKNTYGTGCFLLQNTGKEIVHSERGLITTVAVSSDGSPCYALEGSVFVAGAAIQWLRDELGLLASAAQSEAAAQAVVDNAGVYLVPAFVGLGAPHWDAEARGTIIGLTRGTTANHIIRAGLEAMAYQTRDVFDTMCADAGLKPESLMVDGGASGNDFLMQFQADILGVTISRPETLESTSLGAAYLAGLGAGIWTSADELRSLRREGQPFVPGMAEEERCRLLQGWQDAMGRTLSR